MKRLWPVAYVLIASTSLTLVAFAQDPSSSTTTTNPSATTPTPAKKAVTRTQARQRRSIVHHYPYPYPGYYHSDRNAGWRNPGGVGRYGDYYPAGDRFQANDNVERDPVSPATFGNGGIPSRDEQLQAQQIGVQKDRVMQDHIDNYARPYYGYGFGVGYFGGYY
ncbi:hypothetical protein [Singulisphaera sp. PoT]|uniref:hypothetical protein n=1 Tax=Singulisphaera sp. PoT TaxID=3411797 RepID=UPI003BF61D93